MSVATIFFVAVQLTMLLASASIYDGTLLRGFSFHGVLTAQCSMVGIWLGLGKPSLIQRSLVALVLVTFLAFVAKTRPSYNPWELYFAITQMVILSTAFSITRSKRKLVIQTIDEPTNEKIGQLTLSKMLLLVTAFALLFAIYKSIDFSNVSTSGALFLAYSLMLGVTASSVPLIASAVALGKTDFWTVALSGLALITITSTLALIAANSYRTFLPDVCAWWFAAFLIETAALASSIAVLRWRGLGLVRGTPSIARIS